MSAPTLEDILGIGQTKLGFFHEWQINLKELQQAHAESEHRRLANAAILEAIPDVMMVLDEDLRLLFVNHVFESVFPVAQAPGRHCHLALRRRDTPCPDCPALRCLEQRRAVRQSSIFGIDGGNLHFDITAAPMPHPSGSGRAVLVFMRDVTPEKRLLAQMYQTEKMASVGLLAAGVAHEINNPLTAVAGFAEGLQRRLPRLKELLGPIASAESEDILADLAEYSQTILRESGRCRDIVQALLQFSRPLPSRQAVRLDALIEETLSLLRHPLKQHARVLFCLDLDPSLPELHVDDTQLRQVLLNLVVNALDALRAGGGNRSGNEDGEGTVTIRTGREDDHVVLQVEDTGCGVPAGHLHAVFEPFFTTKSKGLGLGLSVCYSVVEAHNGEIFLDSKSGGPTRVTVRLPLGRQPEPPAPE